VKNDPEKIAKVDYCRDIDSGACGWVWWELIHSPVSNVNNGYASSNGYSSPTGRHPDTGGDTKNGGRNSFYRQ
jgi:hypothetical protein